MWIEIHENYFQPYQVKVPLPGQKSNLLTAAVFLNNSILKLLHIYLLADIVNETAPKVKYWNGQSSDDDVPYQQDSSKKKKNRSKREAFSIPGVYFDIN